MALMEDFSYLLNIVHQAPAGVLQVDSCDYIIQAWELNMECRHDNYPS